MSPVAEVKRITELILLLGEDQPLLGEFERDPRTVLEASGLTDAAIATLLAGDPAAVRAAVDEEVVSDPSYRRPDVAPRMTYQPPEPEPPKPEPEPDDEGD